MDDAFAIWICRLVVVLGLFLTGCGALALLLALIFGRLLRPMPEGIEHFKPGGREPCRSADETSSGPPVLTGIAEQNNTMKPNQILRTILGLIAGLLSSTSGNAAALEQARKERDECLANDAADRAKIAELEAEKTRLAAQLAESDAADASAQATLRTRIAELEQQIADLGEPLNAEERQKLDELLVALQAATPSPSAPVPVITPPATPADPAPAAEPSAAEPEPEPTA